MGKVGFFKQKTIFSKEILVGVLEEWTDFRVKLTDINSDNDMMQYKDVHF